MKKRPHSTPKQIIPKRQSTARIKLEKTTMPIKMEIE